MTAPRRIVVVGAARSGTKLLRDTLALATGAGAVPYDIGFVWRSALPGHPDDRLPVDSLDPRRAGWIRGVVDRYAEGTPGVVVEKSVGTVMRVPYVAAVVPDAFFVHVVRDGTDVVESTYRQWTAPTDLSYLVRKVRHVPWRVLPSYGLRYVRSVVRRRVARDGRVGSWGPRYPGIDADLREESLLTVCARQWCHGVAYARSDLAASGVMWTEVRYEDLVRDPASVVAQVASGADLDVDPGALTVAAHGVDTSRIGRGTRSLPAGAFGLLDGELGPTLDALGYGRPQPAAGGVR